MQYTEAEDRTGMDPDALKKLVHDGNIRKKPWYLPPFSVDLLRRGDVRKYKKPPSKKG
jgi:hypothetical protein